MPASDPCLIRSRGSLGEPVVRLGMPLVDDYLEFLTGLTHLPPTVRARPCQRASRALATLSSCPRR